MNKRLFGIVAVLTVLMSVSVLADVTVHGTVKLADGVTDAGPGVEVTVECDNGDDVISDSDFTDANSEYAVTFTTEECDLGDEVVASVPGMEVSDEVTEEDLRLEDLYILNIELSIPEFSAIAAGVAFAGAGLGYVALRRRK